MEDPLYPSTNTSRSSSLRKKRGIISALEAQEANGGRNGGEKEGRNAKERKNLDERAF